MGFIFTVDKVKCSPIFIQWYFLCMYLQRLQNGCSAVSLIKRSEGFVDMILLFEFV